jgi:hypothetical protein
MHTLKAYAAVEVSRQLHLPITLPPVKYRLIATEQEAGRAIEPVQTLWRKISALNCSTIPQSSSPWSSNYTR